MTFQGFSPETIDFLWGIRLNNNREWFEANKTVYQNTLYYPMKALGEQVFAAFADVPNMANKVSRIYKDARLHPPVPYKESLWLSMRPDGHPWSEQPTLYFEIRPDGYAFGFVLWHPKQAAMAKFRQMLDDRPGEFLELVKKVAQKSGITFGGQEYARKKPCKNSEAAPYYNLKNIMLDIDRGPDDKLFSPDLAEEVIATLKALYPLYEYCLKFTAQP